MVWLKTWLDTRWRFLIGFALLLLSACGIAVSYVQVEQLIPTVRAMNIPEGPLTERIEEAMEIQSTYNGFVWSQWFRGNLSALAMFFAAILGSGSPLSGAARGVTFSLALPVSRGRWLETRASLGLLQLLALVLVPSLVVVLISPLIGQTYSLGAAVVHSISVFIGGAVFFGIAFLLSTVFTGVLRPLLITCFIAIVIGFFETRSGAPGVFWTMAAESYFRDGAAPWIGWLVSVVLTGGLLYAAIANVERRDY
jgi:hypothetical protein